MPPASQPDARKWFLQDLIHDSEEGQQKSFEQVEQMTRSSQWISCQEFEGFRQFCHHDSRARHSGCRI